MDLLLNELYAYLIDKYADNVEIIRNPASNRTSVIIKYPEINIKNSEGRTHKIVDLYVRFILCYDLSSIWILNTIEGARGVLSFAEYNTGYVHSHLKRYVESFSDFCLGSTGGLPSVIVNLVETGLNVENFELFLIQLKAFLSWESLEGVPYCHISNLTIYSPSGHLRASSEDLQNYLRHNTSFPIRWENIKGLRYEKKVDENHPDYIEGLLIGIRSKGFMVDGRFVQEYDSQNTENSIININRERRCVLMFKDNIIIREVLFPEEGEGEIEREYVPAIEIKKYITNSLNHKLNEE